MKTKIETAALRSEIKEILTDLFTDEKDGWEIPDEVIVGKFKHQFESLKARVDSLTKELLAMKGAKPAAEEPTGRVDVASLAEAGKQSKKNK